MLSIYVYPGNSGAKGGFLDVSQDITLSMESLADIFDEDLSTGDFSLPIDIPWTDNNRKLLGFAERLKNNAAKQLYWKVDVYDDGFPELMNGKLTILEKVGKWSYSSGKFSASIAGTKGLWGSQVKAKQLRDLHLGGTIAWIDKDSRHFANDLMHGSYPEFQHIHFAPVAIESFIDSSRADYDDEFLAKDTVNNVIVGSTSWQFGRPSAADAALPAVEGDAEYKDYRTVPFFNFKYVVRACFEELGWQVEGAFMDNLDFDHLSIFNNYSIENYSAILSVDYNRSILPRNHVPDLTVADFLKKVFAFFNIYPSFPGNNRVQLRYREATLQHRTVASLNGILNEDFDSTLQDAENTTAGYKLQYAWDQNDSYYSERLRDISDKTLVGSVKDVTALDTLNIGRQLTTNDIAFVEAENMYYVVADATVTPAKWEAYSEELNEYYSGDGNVTVDAGVSTLCRYVVQDADTGLQTAFEYCGTRQPGSYINNKGVRVAAAFDVRLFYINYRLFALSQYPVSHSNNMDAAGNKIEKYSLAWKGDDGMAVNFHAGWRALNENMEVVKTSIGGVTRKTLKLLHADSYEYQNVDFLPYKIERSIPANEQFDVSMVPM